MHDVGHVAHLVHHLGVDVQAAGGVDNEDVAAQALRLLDALAGNVYGIAGLAEHGDIDLAAEDTQLFDGGRALEVGADEQGVAALLLEPAGQLAGRCRLTGALQAGEQ